MQAHSTSAVPLFGWRHVHVPALIAYGALLLLVIWQFRYLPFADFNEWTYQAFITRTLLDGTGSAVFYLREYPVPYVTSQAVMTALNFLTDPVTAGRWTVTLYLAAAAVVARRFVVANRLRPELAYPALLVGIVCNSSFWSGYLNYQCGLLVLMAYLSIPSAQRRQPWVVCLVSLAAFACHGFCLLAFGVMAGMQALIGSWRERLAFAAAMLPAAALTLWYLLAKSNDAMPALHAPVSHGDLRFLAYKFYTLSKAGPYQNFMIGDGTDLNRWPVLFWLGCLANLVISVLLLVWQYRALRRPAAEADDLRALRWAAISLGLACLVAPATAMQIVNPGERLLYPQLLLVFVLCLRQTGSPSEAGGRSLPGLGAVAVLMVSLASLVSLVVATEREGYQAVRPDVFGQAQQGYTERFYWHRPYQFLAMQDHMMARYAGHQRPDMPITFTTSLIGMMPTDPPITRPTP